MADRERRRLQQAARDRLLNGVAALIGAIDLDWIREAANDLANVADTERQAEISADLLDLVADVRTIIAEAKLKSE